MGKEVMRNLFKSFEGIPGLYVVVICLVFSIGFPAHSQVLTFEEAVKEMLEKNFDIRIVENNKEISELLNSAANAGFLPTVDAAMNYEQAVSNTDQEFLDGRTDSQENANRTDLSASLMLNWTLFDGFSMFAQKDILESNEKLGGYYLRAASEEAIAMLAALYYKIVQQEEAIKVSREALTISRERYRLASRRAEVGSGSQQEVTQAGIDLNTDSAMLLTQLTAVANLKTELNMMLARQAMSEIAVEQIIPVDSNIALDEVLNGTANSNVNLLIARENTRIAHLQIKQARSTFYPEIGVYAGYNYGNTTSEVGFLRSNQSHGPSVGFFVNFNLFNGLKDYKNVQARIIQEENAQINADKSHHVNEGLILNAYRNYDLGLELLKLARENVRKSEENVKIALRRFELGDINSVEFREIQLQMITTKQRQLDALYAVKTNEVEMKRLSGVLNLSRN